MTTREYLKSIGRKEIIQIVTGKKTGEFLITPEQLEEFGKIQFNEGIDAVFTAGKGILLKSELDKLKKQ
jgi:hypothetical protein